MSPTMSTANNVIDIFLQPGEYFAGAADCRICTFLGSCVSITLWHPARRIGAMSHFILPSRGTDPDSRQNFELDARYGEEAMRLMLRDLARLKVAPVECHGKIFGGGNMFPQRIKAGMPNVGQKNGEAARFLLRSHGIPVISESLFGAGHRNIIFDVNSGHVWSRQVKLAEADLPEMKEAA